MYDEISVSIVADEGIPLTLSGADRYEATRRMCEAGIPFREQGRRLKVTYGNARLWAMRHDLELRPMSPRVRALYGEVEDCRS